MKTPLILPPKDRKEKIEEASLWMLTFEVGKPIRVKLEIARPDRTEQQNKYLWAVPYELLSQLTGYEKEDLHEHFCGEQWGRYTKKVPKSKGNPSGIVERPIRTTTRNEHGDPDLCTAEEFVALWEKAQRVGAKLDIIIPDPDPNWWKA